MHAGFGRMPKHRAPDTLRVLVAVPSYHKDLLADLQTVSPRGRAARLRLLAELGLLRAGGPTATPTVTPPPLPSPNDETPTTGATPFGVDEGAPRRAKMGKIKGRVLG